MTCFVSPTTHRPSTEQVKEQKTHLLSGTDTVRFLCSSFLSRNVDVILDVLNAYMLVVTEMALPNLTAQKAIIHKVVTLNSVDIGLIDTLT